MAKWTRRETDYFKKPITVEQHKERPGMKWVAEGIDPRYETEPQKIRYFKNAKKTKTKT